MLPRMSTAGDIVIVSQSPEADRIAGELHELGFTVDVRRFPLTPADASAGPIVLDR